VVDRAALPALRTALEAGRGGCFAAFQASCAALNQSMAILQVESLIQAGQVAHPGRLIPARWFLNVNQPRDLCRAETCFTGESRKLKATRCRIPSPTRRFSRR